MTTWTARRLAWSVGIVSIVLLLAALVLMFVDRGSDVPSNVAVWSASDVLDVLVSLGVPVLGIVIVNKRPKNAIGWIFIVAGTALALGSIGQTYAVHALRADPGSLPAGRALAWVSNVLWPIPIVALTVLFLLFPTGHLPFTALASRRLARGGHLRRADRWGPWSWPRPAGRIRSGASTLLRDPPATSREWRS